MDGLSCIFGNIFRIESGEGDGECLDGAKGVSKVEGEVPGCEFPKLEDGGVSMIIMIEDVVGVDEEILRGGCLDTFPSKVETQTAEVRIPFRKFILEGYRGSIGEESWMGRPQPRRGRTVVDVMGRGLTIEFWHSDLQTS